MDRTRAILQRSKSTRARADVASGFDLEGGSGSDAPCLLRSNTNMIGIIVPLITTGELLPLPSRSRVAGTLTA
jgi:hypothetical protein